MKFEQPMPFECHPSCVYRKLVRGKGMMCTNDDAEAGMLAEGVLACPVGKDYFDHMDVFHAVIRTERGFVGLNVISGEPMMVEPAIMKYMEWLRTRRRSASLWKAPLNIEDMADERTVTDAIYAEFILGRSASKMIRRLAKAAYPGRLALAEDVLLMEKELIEKAYWAWYKDRWITRTDFMKVRNQFKGWE